MNDMLKKPVDKINDAFNGNFGKSMEHKTRKRVESVKLI